MTIARTVALLTAGAGLLLLVVILRGETAALHYDTSQIDRRMGALRLQWRENELEIARLRNPARIMSQEAARRMARSADQDALPRKRAADGG